MAPVTPIWRLVLPLFVIGAGNAFIWSPLAATATRNLPSQLAGASSGVYNATRQVGAVLGSAGMAAFMTSRITAEMPRSGGQPNGPGSALLRLPEFLREPFSAAMSQSVLLPAFIALFGVAAALIMVGFVGWLAAALARRSSGRGDRSLAASLAGAADRTERIPAAFHEHDEDDEDDDAYVEFTLTREPHGREPSARQPESPRRHDPPNGPAQRPANDDTAPLGSRVEHPPARTSRARQAESTDSISPNGVVRSALDGERDSRTRAAQSSPVDDRSFDELGFEELWSGRSAGRRAAGSEAPRNRHHRGDPGASGRHGRHSYPD